MWNAIADVVTFLLLRFFVVFPRHFLCSNRVVVCMCVCAAAPFWFLICSFALHYLNKSSRTITNVCGYKLKLSQSLPMYRAAVRFHCHSTKGHNKTLQICVMLHQRRFRRFRKKTRSNSGKTRTRKMFTIYYYIFSHVLPGRTDIWEQNSHWMSAW